MKFKKAFAVITALSMCAASLAFTAGCADNGSLALSYSFDEEGGDSARDAVSGKDYHINYVFSDVKASQEKVITPAHSPLRKKGAKGNSLYMDGATSITNSDFSTPRTAFTLSAWVAPRVFENLDGYYSGEELNAAHEIGEVLPLEGHSRMTSVISKGEMKLVEGFVLGYGRLGRWGLELAVTTEAGDDVVFSFYDPLNTLELYQWSHISASYDGKTGYVGLFFNGERAFEGIIPELVNSKIVSTAEPLYIGGCVNPASEYGEEQQFVSGLIDEVKIWKESLAPADLRQEYRQAAVEGHPALDFNEIAEDPSVYEGDCYRPQYHAIPPAAWMNEPHAPFYYKGRYHVFYQHNPAGAYFAQLRWGHLVSDDMIHWEYVKDAVVPTEGICPQGVWTGGSVIGPDGTPWLVITAGTNDPRNGSGQNIAFAHAKDPEDPDLTEWVVEDKLAIVQPNDNSEGELNEFRDPFVWKDGETYYMLVSSSVAGAGGTAQVYTSENMREWDYRGRLYENNNSELGIHWECVTLLPVSNGQTTKYAMFITPQYAANSEKIVESWYFLGSFDKENCRFIPDSAEPRLFDLGYGHFTGQNGFCYLTEEDKDNGKTEYEQGRTVMYAIAQGKDAGTGHNLQSGWAHNFAMPIELSLSDDGNEIVRAPIKELESVRAEELYSVENASKTAEQINAEVGNIRGDMLEIRASFTINNTQNDYSCGIKVRYNPNGSGTDTEYTDIAFENTGVRIKRAQSSLLTYVNKTEGKVWETAEKNFDVTILLDRSMLEVYINGTISFTTRIYPKYGNSDYLKIFDEGAGITFSKFKVYRMGSAYSETVTPPYYGDTGELG